MNTHNRVLKTGLLGGLSDADTRRSWPAWVSTHVAECWECKVMIAAVPLLREASEERPGRPAPTVAELRARPRRPLPPPDQFADDMRPFAEKVYRRGKHGGLELSRTSEGFCAWDPDALHLLLFAVSPDRAELLVERRRETPGVSVDVDLASERGGRIVALAFAEPADAALWQIWLSQWEREGRTLALDGGAYVHMAELPIGSDEICSPLRLLSGPFPDSPPHIHAVLNEALAATRVPDLVLAISHFTRLRTLGFAEGDAMAKARGGIGLGQALFSLGFFDDSGEVLRSTIAECDLDQQRAGQVCLAFAWRALLANDFAGAAGWMAEAVGVRPTSEWLAPIHRQITFLRQDWEAVLRLDAEQSPDATPSVAETRAYLAAVAHARLGDAEQARARVEIEDCDPMLEARIWRFVALACIARAESGAWHPDLASSAAELLGDAPLDLLEQSPLAFLATACASEAPACAAALLRARFLSGGVADLPVLALAGADRQLVAATPDGAFSQLALDRLSLGQIVARLREEVILGRTPRRDALFLADAFFPKGIPMAGLYVASDGVLAGVPWPLLLTPDGQEAPAVVEVLGRGAATAHLPTSTHAVSLADPSGDLPLAGGECAGMGVIWRGDHVTSGVLSAVGEVGLIHLGVHVQRDRGMPELLLADGPMSAAAIGELRLGGYPVVLLAACGSADQPTPTGVERSLSNAFLRAGASAVVATRWPLTDQEAHDLFCPLLALWPFTRVEFAVAKVTSALKRAGHPPRVWASLAVYRA